jgi:hypothetical protein
LILERFGKIEKPERLHIRETEEYRDTAEFSSCCSAGLVMQVW